MLRNYIIIAFRNLQRNSFYSGINIVGLAIGIACSILILLWVNDELSYNRFHANYDQLYKVHINKQFSDGISTQETVPYALAEAIKNKTADVKNVVMTNWGEGNLLTAGDVKLNKVGMCTGEAFLTMFSFELVKGDAQKALLDPHSIVLTESTALALFGESDPLGKIIKVDNNLDVTVTGVVKDVPNQSTFRFDYLLPYSYYELTQPWIGNAKDQWGNNSFQVYVQLQPAASLSTVNQRVPKL